MGNRTSEAPALDRRLSIEVELDYDDFASENCQAAHHVRFLHPPNVPKFKDLFALANSGNFGMLVAFSMAHGERKDPTESMREPFVEGLVKRFDVPTGKAEI